MHHYYGYVRKRMCVSRFCLLLIIYCLYYTYLCVCLCVCVCVSVFEGIGLEARKQGEHTV